jgi:hypothetical protein
VTTNHDYPYPANDPPDDLSAFLSAAQNELADYVRAKVDPSAALMAIMAASAKDAITTNQLATDSDGDLCEDVRLAEPRTLGRVHEGPADSDRPDATSRDAEAIETETENVAAASVGTDRASRKPAVAVVKSKFAVWFRAIAERWPAVKAGLLTVAVVAGCGLGLAVIVSAGGPGMAVIEALALAVAAGFALIVMMAIVVTIGIHQEERHRTVIRGRRPATVSVLLARRVLGAHFDLIPEERFGEDSEYEDPGGRPSLYEIQGAPAETIRPVRRQ